MRSKAARQEFYAAIVEYYYKGEEPEFRTEAAEIGFEGVRFSLAKARAGRLGGMAEPTANQTPTKRQADPEANAQPNAKQTANETPTKEEEGKSYDFDYPQESPFALACLKALNDELGTMYSSMPPKCTRTLERFSGLWSPEQVRGMVAFKRREWEGTRFRRHMTPNTLFSPDHFEQYMHQALADQEEARYAEYD